MLKNRLELHQILCEILGSSNTYFQPPESEKMGYPAITYSRSIVNKHADDRVYAQSITYQLIVIDSDPDSEIVEKISKLPRCRFDRHYTSNNLHHTVFTIVH